jgi:hypothetical protein
LAFVVDRLQRTTWNSNFKTQGIKKLQGLTVKLAVTARKALGNKRLAEGAATKVVKRKSRQQQGRASHADTHSLHKTDMTMHAPYSRSSCG